MDKDLAIRVEHLSKRFRIGEQDEAADNFATAIVRTVKSPFSNYKKYRSIYQFDETEDTLDGNGSDNLIWALRDVSFDVPRGQVMGIVGTNGAGKSTLLKVLSQITPPTHGKVTIRGRVSSLLEVGTGFHHELTGRENVYLNGTIMGMRKKEIDQKFDEIVEFSGVEKFLDTPVKRYSSGMRVRLAFAVAAHLEPEVLIIDEVLAVGDAAFQRKCLDKMEDVSSHGRTVLFVSHNMPAITRLCSRAILLKQGAMVMDGTSTEVVSAYLSEGHGMTAERQWNDDDAPGDHVARLHRFRAKNSQNETLRSTDIREPIGIEVEYEVLEGGRLLMPYVTAWNEDGVKLFIAVETDPAWLNRKRPAGRYCTTVWIPGNMLSEGVIYLSAHMKTLEPTELHYHAHQEIAVQIVDTTEGGSARGAWVGVLDGAFRPKLDWETTVYESKDSVTLAT
jgi:lipopolysaccharide transport system ATP-binding protein